ncbi:MAG TPA: hypothetical protein VHM25_27900 [Polyangiaceae bacterium]|jgi:hypothetical protein|nr:hypothetical protein [Polyangiaceae bacterium]
MRNLAVVAAFGTALLASLASRGALAAANEAILLPTAVPTKAEPALPAEDAEQLSKVARQLDAILSEAVQDLGLTLTVSNRTRVLPTDDALVERARDSWLISPRVSLEGSGVRLRIVAVAPGENVLRERSQHVDAQTLEIRANLMMRDVVHSAHPTPENGPTAPAASAPERTVESEAPRSQGRAVLALNAAVVGGYVGFSLQRASGSSDPRLTYPLVALGTGIGLGASMLVADEWDVTLGDAWFLSAGAWWPIASGVLIAKSYDVQKEDLYVYGLVAASAGVSLSVAALSSKPMSEGGALLAHSGGAAGTLLGGLTQMAVEGKTDFTPERGMGYGAGIGVLTAGALATQVKVTSSRMLLIDLAASLGALTGAAAASPLLLVDESEDPTRNRVWLASIAAGTVVGGAIGWFSTRGAPVKDDKPLRAMPYFNLEPANPSRGTRSFMSLGLQGLW